MQPVGQLARGLLGRGLLVGLLVGQLGLLLLLVGLLKTGEGQERRRRPLLPPCLQGTVVGDRRGSVSSMLLAVVTFISVCVVPESHRCCWGDVAHSCCACE